MFITVLVYIDTTNEHIYTHKKKSSQVQCIIDVLVSALDY